MKFFFISLLFSIFLIQRSPNHIYENNYHQTIRHKEDTTIHDQLYEVIKIDSQQKVYLIYAKRNSSVYKIVSKKECTSKCRNVIIGEKYKFELTSFHNLLPYVKRGTGIRYNDTIIKLEGGDILWDLFTCMNLDNLCFEKPN